MKGIGIFGWLILALAIVGGVFLLVINGSFTFLKVRFVGSEAKKKAIKDAEARFEKDIETVNAMKDA